MSWGILPLFFAAHGLGIEQIGMAACGCKLLARHYGSYDHWREEMLAARIVGSDARLALGSILGIGPAVAEAMGLVITAGTGSFGWWLLGSILLGAGTAMVYPTQLAAVSDASGPAWRARGLSVCRFWRDLGYAIGALVAGMLGLKVPIVAVGALTFLSGVVVVDGRQSCCKSARLGGDDRVPGRSGQT